MKKILIPAMFLVLCFFDGKIYGQSVQFTDVFLSDYPHITAGFKLYDAQGNEIRNFTKNDSIVNEISNGQIVQREVTDIDCPSLTLRNFSAVFSIDISQSMSEYMDGGMSKIDAVKMGLNFWFTSFDPKRTEIAITAFCGDAVGSVNDTNRPIQEMTSDKDSLMSAVQQIPPLCQGTNYNAALFHKNNDTSVQQLSALYWCRPDKARYKPVIVFITDGNHEGQYGGGFDIGEANLLALIRNVTIYVIQMGTEPITQENLNHLNALANMGKAPSDQTPNIWMGVNNPNDIQTIFQEIFNEAGMIGDPASCYLTWETDCGGSSATISFPNHGGVSDVVNYQVNQEKKPSLEISPDTLVFYDTKLSESSNKEVTLTAKNTDISIDSYVYLTDVSASDRIVFNDFIAPFVLSANSNSLLNITYFAGDTNSTLAKIRFVNSACYEDTLTIIASPVTAVENEFGIDNDITIIPNPADDFINIELPQNINGTMKVIIFDVLGNEITKKDFINFDNNIKLDIKSLANGNYFIGCFSEDFNKIVPLVVCR